MSLSLLEYLTKLSTDTEMMDAYKTDRESAMRGNKVSEGEIKLVLDSNYEAIRKLVGSNYDITTNHIVKIFKK